MTHTSKEAAKQREPKRQEDDITPTSQTISYIRFYCSSSRTMAHGHQTGYWTSSRSSGSTDHDSATHTLLMFAHLGLILVQALILIHGRHD